MPVTCFFPADVGRDIVAQGGRGTITAYTNGQTVTGDVVSLFPATSFAVNTWSIEGTPLATCTPSADTPVGATITLTLSAAGWRASDVGKFVEINGGLCKITVYTSSTIVSAVIVTELASTVACPPFAWVLKKSMWGGGVYGYPRCGALYQQRLWQGGSTAFPKRLWGSVIGFPHDYTLGVNDDDALSYDLESDEYNGIQHLVSALHLLALTTGAEFSIKGGSDQAITPTNIQVKEQSNYGCNRVPPVKIADEVYMGQRAGRKLRALSPNEFDSERYGAPDVTVLSEHVTESGIREFAYAQEPDSILYVPRNDGQLATLTVDRDQEVVAWARQVLDGVVESVAVIPAAEGDRLFLSVARVVDGETVRYTELWDPQLLTDCAITGSNPAGATVWTGLDHLEGRLVAVKGDGVVLQSQIVTGGQITTERTVFNIEIGLNYVTTIKTLTPSLTGPSGTGQGAALSIHEIVVRLRDTIGCLINYQHIAFRKFGDDVLDKPIAPFSGDKVAGNLGWGGGVGQTIIQQNQPYPFHLLAVITKLSVNE